MGLFPSIWSMIIFIVHSYIFFTCFFFLGIEGFPQGTWLVVEIAFEMIEVVDTIIRHWIRYKCPTIWDGMKLLHEDTSKTHFAFVIIGSIPQSLIL